MNSSLSEPGTGKVSPGWREELAHALAQPDLAGVEQDTDGARRAAYWLVVVLGHCRLEGVDLGEKDGSLPPPVAIAAGRHLSVFLSRCAEDVQELEHRLDEAGTAEVEANDLCFELLEARMQAWAAFVALDEAYQVCLEDGAPERAALAVVVDDVLDRMEELDRLMQEQMDLLGRVVAFPLLDNWRSLLAPEYRQVLPWWLDGRLEEKATRVARDSERWLPRRLTPAGGRNGTQGTGSLVPSGSSVNNLFCNLYRWAHRQDENFLTESFVFLIRHLLQHEPGTASRFLGWLCFEREESHPFETGASVTTQFTTDQGRPDVLIDTRDAHCLLEVKKDSGLGEFQLERYRAVLNRSEKQERRLVLVTAHAVTFADNGERPDRSARWSDVAGWLRKQQLEDPVSRFLVEQFLYFLKSEVMTVEQVSGDYLNGVKAFQNLVRMIGRALELANVPIHDRRNTTDANGYYLDGRQFWAGIWYQTPELVYFGFYDAKPDLKKFHEEFEERGKLDRGKFPYFSLQLDDEATHFFARSADSQLAVLKDFFERAYRDCQALKV